jgi:hypothetical protein
MTISVYKTTPGVNWQWRMPAGRRLEFQKRRVCRPRQGPRDRVPGMVGERLEARPPSP